MAFFSISFKNIWQLAIAQLIFLIAKCAISLVQDAYLAPRAPLQAHAPPFPDVPGACAGLPPELSRGRKGPRWDLLVDFP